MNDSNLASPKTDQIATAIGLEVVPADFARAQERRIAELVKTLKYLQRHYVGILEHGRNRILDLGGTCDPVDVMERSDPHLRIIREVLAKESQP